MGLLAEIGNNRTGIATSPELTAEMVESTEEFAPISRDVAEELTSVRIAFARAAEPLGHLPPPLSLKGMAKTAAEALRGNAPAHFIDKVGERLAFERTGVRLYEGLLAKFDAHGGFPGGPERTEIEEVLAEEYEHFKLLEDALDKLGADPTVITPSADLHATISRGIMDAIADPRTTFAQGLEAALVAELADNASWQNLIELARTTDQALSESFTRALTEEQTHLSQVKLWLAAAAQNTH